MKGLQYTSYTAVFLGSLALSIAVVGIPGLFLMISNLEKELNGEMTAYDVMQKEMWSDLTKTAPPGAQKYKRHAVHACPDGSAPAVDRNGLIVHCGRRTCPWGYQCDRNTQLCCNTIPNRNLQRNTRQQGDSYSPAAVPVTGYDSGIQAQSSTEKCECAAANPNPCPPGPKGAPGDAGDDGYDGDAGTDGQPGVDAEPYTPCDTPDCSPCPQGPKGPVGAKGDNGPPGPPGSDGSDGNDGDDGPRGSNGADGSAGANGGNGKPGGKGSPGSPGTKAVPGTPGRKGPNGSSGPAGSAGGDGKDGDGGGRGDAGSAGSTGSAGDRGGPGAAGPPGDDGLPGNDAGYCPCPLRSAGPGSIPYRRRFNQFRAFGLRA